MENDKIRKILIAGGAGFIGSRLANRLISLGYHVIVLDNLATGRKENLDGRVKFYLADIANQALVEKIIKTEKPEVVINQAAKVYWKDEKKDLISDLRTSVMGTINLLNSCHKHKVEKFIFASSISVYGYQPDMIKAKETTIINFDKMPNVLFSYGFSKYCAERYIIYFHKQYGLKYSILRYAHIYGPGQEDDAIAKFIRRAVNHKKIIIYGNGEQYRDYLFIDDAIQATILSINQGDNMLLNIGSGEKTSVNKLIKKLAAATKLKINYTYSGEERDNLKFCMNISLAKKRLNWKPAVSFDQGILKYINSK